MNKISIRIDYWLKGALAPRSVDLSPGDFFDLENGEIPSIDSIPMLDHAFQYINIAESEVAATVLHIHDCDAESSIIIREAYWGEKRNCIIERKDLRHGVIVYHETIHDIEFPGGSSRRRITRIGWHEDWPKLYSDVTVIKNDDGTESERDERGAAE